MTRLSYDTQITALLVIDPYNDFISEGGFFWDRVKGVAEADNCIPHMRAVLDAARKAGLRVYYALHHRYRPGDYETWEYIAPIEKAAWQHKSFQDGTWRGEIRSGFGPLPGDILAHEHWCSSGFANTDLDQQLKVHEMHAALDINLPNYANAIVTTSEVIEAICASPASSLTGGVEHGGTPVLTSADHDRHRMTAGARPPTRHRR